jgi:membrane-associated PAP2 superfamily phosphatase
MRAVSRRLISANHTRQIQIRGSIPRRIPGALAKPDREIQDITPAGPLRRNLDGVAASIRGQPKKRWPNMRPPSHAASTGGILYPRDTGVQRMTRSSPLTFFDRSGRIAATALVAVLFVFELTSFDVAVQDGFYDTLRQKWLLDRSAFVPRIVFHELPNAIAIGVGVALAALLVGPARWRLWGSFRLSRRALLCSALTLASIPASVALGKKLTNVFCPRDLERYGGDVCYVGLTEPFPADAVPNRRGSCFPGGHASGGFALIALCSLARSRRAQIAAMLAALTLGWIAGFYQMLVGAHFLSHTLVSMCLAWLWCIFWRRVLGLAAAGASTRVRSSLAEGQTMRPLTATQRSSQGSS